MPEPVPTEDEVVSHLQKKTYAVVSRFTGELQTPRTLETLKRQLYQVLLDLADQTGLEVLKEFEWRIDARTIHDELNLMMIPLSERAEVWVRHMGAKLAGVDVPSA